MVGVPGKFKGCETCRLRRVKCDNTRPYCKKCHDTGRECAGYDRETVFIIGTPQDGGRCSSHPPRVVKPKTPATTTVNTPGNIGRSSTSVSSSSSSSAKSRSSPKSRSNSRSASVSRTTSNSPAAALSPSPSVPFSIHEQQRYLSESLAPTLSGIMSPAKFDTAVIPIESAMITQRPNVGMLNGISVPDLVLIPPLRSAWHDSLVVASGGIVHQVQTAALYTQLQSIVRHKGDSGTDGGFHLSPFPAYTPTSHNAPLSSGLPEQWKDPAMQFSSVRRTGPARFATFPAHHFFARVYRPNAIWSALIFRQSTFLSDPEWTSTPWEVHPKSGLDRLLDIAALLPAVLSRADNVTAHQPTLGRRMMAQDVLANCLYVERVLEQWHATVQDLGMRGGSSVNGASTMSRAPVALDGSVDGGFQNGGTRTRASGHGAIGNWYWIADPEHTSVDAQIPFADTFAFRDTVTALMFIYYWATLVLLYPCVENLYEIIFQPVLDTFPSPYPNLPSNLQIPNGDPSVYYGPKEVRELAGNVCRGLDFVLSTTVQPDLLSAPLFVVESFYHKMNATSGDGALELLWCESFRSRLAGKGQYIADVIQNRRWVDVGQF
ncbi:c6 zinc finger domain containing protein [Sporothrix brasiliensis 5110]|uniref:C6 zinc finger domain containing protein n=1 Tax=Sporothrix brasiliensis 5110 TaxID=1398154 RepID=A0A0C2ITV5_9PEZI|nr:c6 zinc finger domain containing protein [Sporothrix brasiliensis 5110]KIH90210.1 c6 zinc finger domain containing protein [Sporothrix brasiliensis 5110]